MPVRLPPSLLTQILSRCDQALAVVNARDPGAGLCWVNESFETLTGFGAAELAAEGHAYLSDEDARKRLADHLSIASWDEREAEETMPAFCLHGKRGNGTVAWWEVKSCPLFEYDVDRPSHWLLQFAEKRSVEPIRPRVPSRRPAAKVQTLRPAQHRDPVTGIPGRDHFDEIFRRQFALAQKQEISLAVLLLEVDCFAEYRQTFGPKAGDYCLRMVAHGVQAAMRRSTDLVARIGNTRFAAVGLGMSPEAAAAHAKRIQEEVERLHLHHPRSRVSRYVTVTAVAVSRAPSAHDCYQDMLGAAEERLDRQCGLPVRALSTG